MNDLVNVDLISRDGITGDVASEFMVNRRMDIGTWRPFIEKGKPYVSIYMGGNPTKKTSYKVVPYNHAATLRRDEWKSLDMAVMDIARDRLTGINDLKAKGLVYPLGNAIGTTVLEWHDVGDSMEAIISMDGVTRGQGDRPTFQHNYLPIPIIHVDYEINTRELETSRRMGNPVDTTSAEHAARKVAERLEDMLFTDVTYGYGDLDSRSRNKIYSYVNFPDRIPKKITSWTGSGKTGADIVDDVLDAMQASIDAKHYGPWTCYIPTSYQTAILADYDSTTPGTTIRERLMKLEGITEIKVADHLATDNVLLIEMKKETVRLVEGFDLQNVEWQTEGRFINKYKVLTIQVPQIRSDRNGACGIVHMSV
jgi:uncharacterized linocin/CFP29 family protein